MSFALWAVVLFYVYKYTSFVSHCQPLVSHFCENFWKHKGLHIVETLFQDAFCGVYVLYQLSYIGCYTDSWTRTSDNAIINRTVLIAVSIFKHCNYSLLNLCCQGYKKKSRPLLSGTP